MALSGRRVFLFFEVETRKHEERTFLMALLRPLALSLLLALIFSGVTGTRGLQAAEITGLKESTAADQVDRDTKVRQNLLGGLTEDATVLHLSILPSADDPSILETRIYVQKKGPQTVCISIDSDELISRSYQPSTNDPFDPAVPSVITTDSSGYTGDLIEFNDLKLFIRPHGPADTFVTNECFAVAGETGCLVDEVLECDQMLDEGEEVCAGDALALGRCGGTDHASAIDALKKLVATNQEAPQETAAGPLGTAAGPATIGDFVLQAPEVSTVFDRGTIPGPTLGDIVSTVQNIGGGDELVVVPNIVGLTLPEAEAAIESALLSVGTFTEVPVSGTDSAWFNPVRRAYAQDTSCEPDTVCSQSPAAGSFAKLNSAVNGTIGVAQVDTPLPPAIAIFLTGLVLIFGLHPRLWRRAGNRLQTVLRKHSL
jgi:hypothetical protein